MLIKDMEGMEWAMQKQIRHMSYFQALERSENILLLGTNTNKSPRSGSENILVMW